MKNIIKYIAASAAIVCSVSALTACGEIDVSKIKGDWTATSVNDMSLADYAASVGYDEALAAWNITITDDNVVSTTSVGSSTMTYTKASNGITATDGASSIPLTYDESANTLTVEIATSAGTTNKYVFTKGTYDFSAAASAGTAEAVSTSDAYVSTAEVEYYGSYEYYTEEG